MFEGENHYPKMFEGEKRLLLIDVLIPFGCWFCFIQVCLNLPINYCFLFLTQRKIVILICIEVVCSSSEAVNRIYEIKGRKHTSPLAICVGDISDIQWFAATEHLPDGLLNALLPGPVTLILKRGNLIMGTNMVLCSKSNFAIYAFNW